MNYEITGMHTWLEKFFWDFHSIRNPSTKKMVLWNIGRTLVDRC
jgi:hypothetical protein